MIDDNYTRLRRQEFVKGCLQNPKVSMNNFVWIKSVSNTL